MTSASHLLIIVVLLVSDCYCESSLISSQSIDVNNEHPSLQHNSWIDTLATNSQLNPSLVQGLTSPLTTTSYNVLQESLSSMDYLPLVKATMSSAYSRFKNDTKSTESVLMNSLNRSDLPSSIQGDNQISKHHSDDQVMESSVGSLDEFLTDYENNQMKTIENYYEVSSLDIYSIQTFLTPNLNSITYSIDVHASSTPLIIDTNDFHANSFGIKHTSQISNFETQRLFEPSEWKADIFPSVAYDEALYSAFSFSNTQEYDYSVYDMETSSIQSNQKEESSSSIPSVSPMESDINMLTSSNFEVEVIPATSQGDLHSTQSFPAESSQTMWSDSEFIPFSQDYLIPFSSESYLSSSSQISPVEVNESSSILREITLNSSSVDFLIEMTSASDIPYHKTSLKAHDTSSSFFASSIPTTGISPLTTTTTAMPNTTTDFPTTTTALPTTTTDRSTTTTVKLTTTVGKVIFKDCRFLFTFSGDCHLIMNNTLFLAEFIESLKKSLVESLHISNDRIKAHDIACGSIKIYVTFKNVSYPEFKRRLEYIVDGRNFIVPTYIENVVITFTALSVEEVALPPGDVDSSDLPQHGIDNIDIIVIIVACCVCGILIVIGITVCVKECYKRKYAQSFDLLDMPHVNLKLEDFTLTRIPRPKTSYNTDNVTVNPYTDRYNQQTKKENGQQVSNGNHIDLKDVHVRMQPLKNEGIIVGVTGYASSNGAPRKKKRAPSASSRQSNEDHLHGDPSTESLVPESNSSSMGASNPIFVDDEQGSTSTLEVNRSYQS